MGWDFLARRLAGILPLLFGISVILFAIIHLAPGGPLDVYADNPSVTPEALEQLKIKLGLDKPLPEQYVRWTLGVLTGDWGYSIRTGRPVMTEIVERLPATLQLGGLSLALSFVIAMPLGAISAMRRHSALDHGLTALSFAGISIPVFWLALILQLIFSIWLGWLPSAGYASFGDGSLGDRLAHLVMPVIVLSAATIASWSRYVRASVVEALGQDYIRTARAKGLGEWAALTRHALRNALLPTVTIVALDVGSVVSGAVVTETVFAWPGLGRLFVESMDGRDYPVLMGLMMIGSAAVILSNIVADILYTIIDPRVRYG